MQSRGALSFKPPRNWLPPTSNLPHNLWAKLVVPCGRKLAPTHALINGLETLCTFSGSCFIDPIPRLSLRSFQRNTILHVFHSPVCLCSISTVVAFFSIWTPLKLVILRYTPLNAPNAPILRLRKCSFFARPSALLATASEFVTRERFNFILLVVIQNASQTFR